jgi:hypothetical protein
MCPNRSEVDDQIGLCGHHDFEVGRIAAPGEAADFRQAPHDRRKIGKLLGRRLSVPAD